MALKERVDFLILKGPARIATKTPAGANITIGAGHAYGEAVELRYTSALTGQFQGLFVQVESSGGAAAIARGAEFVGRQESVSAISEATGLHGQGQVRGTGNCAVARGLHGQVSVFSGYSGVLTLAAALYGKFQTEGTITEGYGCLVENEAVTGGVLLTAAFGAKCNPSSLVGWKAAVDVSGGKLQVHTTDQVRLFVFNADDGTKKMISYDRSADALAFANYA